MNVSMQVVCLHCILRYCDESVVIEKKGISALLRALPLVCVQTSCIKYHPNPFHQLENWSYKSTKTNVLVIEIVHRKSVK